MLHSYMRARVQRERKKIVREVETELETEIA